MEADFIRAILSKLQAISPQDFQDVTDALSATNAIHLHLLVPIVLHIEGRNRRTLPLRYLLLVPLRWWIVPTSFKKELSIVLPQVFSFANQRRVSTIILPCLGSNWQNKNETSFDDFFSAFFNSVPTGTVPRDVYLSFYTEWPSFYLETAISALNARWRSSFEKEYQFPGAYRREFRKIFFFLSLCLFITSFSVSANCFKSLCMSKVSLCAAALGATNAIDFLAQGQGPGVAWFVELLTFAILAIGFRYFVRWGVQKYFQMMTQIQQWQAFVDGLPISLGIRLALDSVPYTNPLPNWFEIVEIDRLRRVQAIRGRIIEYLQFCRRNLCIRCSRPKEAESMEGVDGTYI